MTGRRAGSTLEGPFRIDPRTLAQSGAHSGTHHPLRAPALPMSEHPTLAFQESDDGLFTSAEVLALMRVEFDRACRYGHPLACLLISVDRLQYLQDLYGYESKAEILRAVGRVVVRGTRASDLLGCLLDDRLLVVIPHADAVGVQALAERFMEQARRLTFDANGPALKVTLSVGAASVEGLDRREFEALLQLAETGLAVASAAGGDRYVEWRAVQSEVDELRSELSHQAELLGRGHREAIAPAEPEPWSGVERRRAPPPGQPPAAVPNGELEDQILDLFAAHGDDVDLSRLASEIAAWMRTRLESRPGPASETQTRQIDILERRVAKLSNLLGLAEEELRRVAKMKNIDLGIASIYRTVQGLDDHDGQFERKKEMMTSIFEANVKLQSSLRGEPDA